MNSSIAQLSNPYAAFGHEGYVASTPQERAGYLWTARNPDPTAVVQSVLIDGVKGQAYRLGAMGNVIDSIATGESDRARFLSVDPLTASFSMLTPYQFASNTPMVAVDLDGLEMLTIHSADFTEQFMQGKPEMVSDADVLMAIEEMAVRYGPEFGGYFDANSLKHAEQFYNSPGKIISSSTPQAPLTVLGYSNAGNGTPFYFVLYQATTIAEPQVNVEPPLAPGIKNNLSGVQYAAGAAIMKYSGFGHFGRALHNHMNGQDPWTGREGNTMRLSAQGGLTLASYAVGGLSTAPLKAFGIGIAINTTTEVAIATVPKYESEIPLLSGALKLSIASPPSIPIVIGSMILSAQDYDAIESTNQDQNKPQSNLKP